MPAVIPLQLGALLSPFALQAFQRKENQAMLEFAAVWGRMPTMLRPADHNGFTLVELAVSLVVIGLLIGLGTAMVGPLMGAIKVRESRESLGAAVESINSWASSNNRLPDTTNVSGIVRSPSDAWGRDFIYLYDANLAPGSATKDTICGRKTATLTLMDSATGATIPNVAYIIFSQGDDAASNTTLTSGTLTPAPASPPTIAAAGYVAAGDVATVTSDTGGDLVRWVTLDELRTKIGCQGAQLRVVNNELPYANASSAYAANITAEGGVPFTAGGSYRWCIQATGIAAPASKPMFTDADGTTAIPFSADCANYAEGSWEGADYITVNLSLVTQSAKAYTCILTSPPSPPPNPTAWSEVGAGWLSGATYSLSSTVVVGTAAYTCKQPHTASATNQPASGTSWRDYWTRTGSAWASGTAYIAPPATSSFTIFVRDNNDTAGANDNIASKSFVLTVNPQ
jgi:prepilin-type N-terminal cleavage/methylation domain-containing protein